MYGKKIHHISMSNSENRNEPVASARFRIDGCENPQTLCDLIIMIIGISQMQQSYADFGI